MSRRLFAVLPAAGRSVRMGQPKLLLPWGQETVVEHVVRSWRASRATAVILVVHPDDNELAEIARRSGAEVVVPVYAPPDMKASVCQALRHIDQSFAPRETDGWLLAPADMPSLTVTTIDWVIDQVLSSASEPSLADNRIAIPTHLGERGHPVFFPWPLAAKAFQLAPDQGLNALVARHEVHELPCSSTEVLEDVDHPDDYRKLHNRHHRQTPPPHTPGLG